MSSTETPDVPNLTHELEQAQERLKWETFQQQLEKRRKVDLLIRIPALFIFIVLMFAVAAERPEVNRFWGTVVAVVALVIALVNQMWPQPRMASAKPYDGPIGRKPPPF
ncbi:hypothetical protein A2853_01265 [Candidatus Kaiserbacteria bacterium RIFCSPHIGHO2_01_FULL_55_17]|uniref:Uncharacterized protein n=1 Tax=Candidatus Kaiserbacteria bacterium RIFCSPHIGHO2_01_FULL_55_17 TaxID=1798484 RepID=A0A1F6D9Y4_9BACT|nr:MAG: hypothetical protein A2853_01265 [Candidatus Kaiserbacteria bacterium RIFCSPHIGHO2_01_FULL_55_17]